MKQLRLSPQASAGKMPTYYVAETGTVPGGSHFLVYGPPELALGCWPPLFACLFKGRGLSGGSAGTRAELELAMGVSELRAGCGL